MSRKKTQDEFVSDAREVHGDTYDYSKSVYVSDRIPLVIICPTHGEFLQRPTGHLQGYGCPTCGGKVKVGTPEFIEKCLSVHGYRYDYSKTVYLGAQKPIEVICKKHGTFYVTASHHINRNCGCQKCTLESRTSSTSEFISKARKVHGEFYDYSKVEYIKNSVKVVITCPLHGDFSQSPKHHLGGEGCYECGREKASDSLRMTQDEFISGCITRHGDTYDYSHTVYTGKNKGKVKILCRVHGEFFQRAVNHLRGDGCSKCGIEKVTKSQSYDLKDFIDRANEVHDHYYDYSQSVYTDSQTKVIIVCPKHGPFQQAPASHLYGQGCSDCSNEEASLRYLKTKDEFISDAVAVHGNRYDYTNSDYKGVFEKVEIQCKIHGSFFQSPDAHVNGEAGCPKCHLSKGELKIMRFAETHGLSLIHQKSFDDCRNPKTNRKLKFDFYDPIRNLLIEYDGEQHFKKITFGTHPLTDDEIKDIQFKDGLKTEYAKKKGIKLLRIPFTQLRNLDAVLAGVLLT